MVGGARHFERLREQNRGGPIWSFFDGPSPRTRRSRSTRPGAARSRTSSSATRRCAGFDQRYQNGFDCQGLWIEVGVERELGLNSKTRDRGVRARRVRAQVPREGRLVGERADARLQAARPVDGLGEQLLHVLGHEHRVHLALPAARCTSRATCSRATARRSGAPAAGPRSPRTSSSATTRTAPTRRSSCASRSSDRPGQSLAVWTTTPWTLPANVAAAVNPEAEYGLRAGRRVVGGRAGGPTRSSSSAPAAPTSSGSATRGLSTISGGRPGGRAPGHPLGGRVARGGHRASSTSRRAAAPRTSSSRASTTCRS